MKDVLLRYIRKLPRSTQQCRVQFRELSSLDTESLLEELRDEGEIAFANGAWYVPDARRPVSPRVSKPAHPKQLPLFADASGRRLTEHERLLERIQDRVRAVRG